MSAFSQQPRNRLDIFLLFQFPGKCGAVFTALRQSYDMYDTILDQSTYEGCLYVGFIGVGAI